MEKTVFITFPRSGHHLVVNVLIKYFSKNTKHREILGNQTRLYCKNTIAAGKLHYCEYYNHCQSTPCSDSKTNLQKNHDFGLNEGIDNNYRYIILYRHPLDAVVSWYRFFVEGSFLEKIFGIFINDKKESWQDFSKKAIIFWKNFIKKWLYQTHIEHKLLMSYEEIIETPIISFINVLKFIDPDSEINLLLLKKCIEDSNIARKNDIKKAYHYDKKFFAVIEKEALNEIKDLGLELKFNYD
jgi:hypothetical protein